MNTPEPISKDTKTLDELDRDIWALLMDWHEGKASLELSNSRIKTLITHQVAEAQTKHLANLSRAVGILDGLGHSDKYLNNEREKLLAELEATLKENKKMSNKHVYVETTPYNSNEHPTRVKQLKRRLKYLELKLTADYKPEKMQYIKSEVASLRYAIECMEFTKINSYPNTILNKENK